MKEAKKSRVDGGRSGAAPYLGRCGLANKERFDSRWFLACHFTGIVCVLLCLLSLVLPSPYVIETAGPTQDVLGTVDGKPVIRIRGVRHYDHGHGRLLLLTVSARGVPGYEASLADTVPAVLDPEQEVLPSEAVFTPGQSADEYSKKSSNQMKQSQDSSVAAALAFSKKHGTDVSDAEISVHMDGVGGPSAGMMYSLGIIDKLTAIDETGGNVIAGTGTMSASGKVGAIGGIRLKMIGARRDGATWFLAPRSNCGEVVGHVPSGLRDVAVDDLDGAYAALKAIGEGKGGSLPHCRVADNRS
ncbi:Lon protease (S16) C-terminal proteolytic domain [Bifidobacterium bombi DSM 19703]|uniref:endopeptidase La n=1 Tax=Bifidobacterium bombi DSM 19703 TaxID=1341695 RepID=A0A080N5U5_9BIFI|nr:Lon protease (S16) C-terminal proteolytic domain [Bifidobacterium bombi DSM 19703]